MKKLSILFVSVLTFGMSFISCNKDDDDPDTSTTAAIEGKWSYNKVSTTALGVTTPEVDYPENAIGCSKNYLEIKTGGAFTDGDYNTGSPCTLTESAGTWTKEGNTFTTVDSEHTRVYEITSLTSSSLVLKRTNTEAGLTTSVTVTFIK